MYKNPITYNFWFVFVLFRCIFCKSWKKWAILTLTESLTNIIIANIFGKGVKPTTPHTARFNSLLYQHHYHIMTLEGIGSAEASVFQVGGSKNEEYWGKISRKWWKFERKMRKVPELYLAQVGLWDWAGYIPGRMVANLFSNQAAKDDSTIKGRVPFR